MIEFLRDPLTDAVVDTVKLIPFLFITYLIMEYLESRTSDKSAALLARTGRFGPLFGASVGVVPQCGFSAAAASLYSGGVISLGTLLAVFLSTSDEMLPIFISEKVAPGTIFAILFGKLLIGAASGAAVDAVMRVFFSRRRTEKHIHDLCEQEHCGCEEEEDGILRPAIRHTLHITLFIFLITLALSILFSLIGEDTLGAFLSNQPYLGVFLSALVGLIPNCAASVMLTELYLHGVLAVGPMMAGLLVSAGVGLLVLFRTNRHTADNLRILGVLYALGVFWGLFISLFF